MSYSPVAYDYDDDDDDVHEIFFLLLLILFAVFIPLRNNQVNEMLQKIFSTS